MGFGFWLRLLHLLLVLPALIYRPYAPKVDSVYLYLFLMVVIGSWNFLTHPWYGPLAPLVNDCQKRYVSCFLDEGRRGQKYIISITLQSVQHHPRLGLLYGHHGVRHPPTFSIASRDPSSKCDVFHTLAWRRACGLFGHVAVQGRTRVLGSLGSSHDCSVQTVQVCN